MLFIDANIYLEFFKSSQTVLKKLLPAIEGIKSEIFVTSQIVDEVNRSKVKVASDSLNGYFGDYSFKSVRLPEHLNDSDKTVATWNTQSAELSAKVKESSKALSEIAEKLTNKIMNSEDAASISLNKIFTAAIVPSVEELSKARLRKELGNPPGKYNDPLGDQITWELLLSRYDGGSPLWIISNDNDYSSKINSTRCLNSYLFSELQRKLGKVPEVFIFDSLAEGIKSYSAHRAQPVDNLPAKEVLDEIAATELSGLKTWVATNGFPPPITCYKCGEKQGFIGPVVKPSQYGGLTYQWLCNSCHDWNDFGEPYDE